MAARRLSILSGGQTGVDRAALDAALNTGTPCGGWCPAGRLAEDGPIPARYPLRELPGAGYAERTARNVSDSDGTVVFTRGAARGGTAWTLRCCREQRRPCLRIDALKTAPEAAAAALAAFLDRHAIHRLNVAGPRASEAPALYGHVYRTLARLLRDSSRA